MEFITLVIAFAGLIYFILVVVAVITVIGIPGHLEKLQAEVNRTSKLLAIVDSNLDSIRNQLTETKDLVAQIRDVQSYKLDLLTQGTSVQNPPNDA